MRELERGRDGDNEEDGDDKGDGDNEEDGDDKGCDKILWLDTKRSVSYSKVLV